MERVNHPDYYKYPNGVECLDIVRYHDFNIGSAIKYLCRAGRKTECGLSNKEKELEDCLKAQFYINDKIEMLKKEIYEAKARDE